MLSGLPLCLRIDVVFPSTLHRRILNVQHPQVLLPRLRDRVAFDEKWMSIIVAGSVFCGTERVIVWIQFFISRCSSMSTEGNDSGYRQNFLNEPNLDKILVPRQAKFCKCSESSHQTPFFLLNSIIPATDRSRGPGLPGKVGTHSGVLGTGKSWMTKLQN